MIRGWDRLVWAVVAFAVLAWLAYAWESATGLTFATRSATGGFSTPEHLARTRDVAVGATIAAVVAGIAYKLTKRA